MSAGGSLSEHLMWQLSAVSDGDLTRTIGIAIIGNIDEDGYLMASTGEILSMGAWSRSDVERVLAIIQGFDPVGVAARDLRECLLLQLRHLGMENTHSETIIRDHITLLQGHKLPKLAHLLDVTIDEIKQHVDIMRPVHVSTH